MQFKPCLIIPIYNHGYALEPLAQEINRCGLHTIVVNDGSTDSTPEILTRLTRKYEWLTTLARSINSGKGAAIRDGLRAAHDRGFTHAICIDGDGQHNTSDIPRFLSAAEQHPHSLILGTPIFGSDAPLIRRIGRELSNFVVAISGWSLQARDVLCGFRVYPLRSVITKVDLLALEPRMGFDVEIVVRSVWAGIPIKNLTTTVTYPEGGVSHFRYARDNMTLIRLYVRLLLGGLWRGPLRIVRAFRAQSDEKRWYQLEEQGSARWLRFLLTVLELLGRRMLLMIMAPIVLYLFLFRHTQREAALDFQRRISRELGTERTWFMTHIDALRQFWSFGTSIVDKVVSWRQELPLERFTWKGLEQVKGLLSAKQGVIFMGAHVGNIEVLRAFGEGRKVVIHTLMFTGHSKQFKRFLESVNENSFLRVHDLQSEDTALVFTLQEAIAQGEIVALLFDRIPKLSSSRSVSVPFLGEPALFPEGPWILASVLEAPVFSAFCMQGEDGRYHVEFELLTDRVILPRNGRVQAIETYVALSIERLTDCIKRYRYQWYNFFDLWRPNDRSI